MTQDHTHDLESILKMNYSSFRRVSEVVVARAIDGGRAVSFFNRKPIERCISENRIRLDKIVMLGLLILWSNVN